MNPEIQELKTKLINLKSFLEKDNFYEDDIIEWASECVAFFSVIKLNESIISCFLKSFENHVQKESKASEDYSPNAFFERNTYYLGPFSRRLSYGTFSKGGNFLYINVALKTAEEVIINREDSERLIPKSLVNIFNNLDNQNIKSALESIELNYQARDPRGMLSPLVTATTEILNLIPEIDKTKNIGSRLQSLYEQKYIHEKYSLNKDIIWSLNTSRIIRNEEVDHQKKQNLGNIPMYEATGCTHLLILFINALLSSCKIRID